MTMDLMKRLHGVAGNRGVMVQLAPGNSYTTKGGRRRTQQNTRPATGRCVGIENKKCLVVPSGHGGVVERIDPEYLKPWRSKLHPDILKELERPCSE